MRSRLRDCRPPRPSNSSFAARARASGRPTAIGYIEQKRAGSVRHVDGTFAGQAEANVILGQHDVGDAGPILRLTFAHPEKFGQRKVGQRRIAGEANQRVAAENVFQFAALGLAALVAPDDGLAHDLVRGVEKNRAVHLPGEADTGDVFRAQIGRVQNVTDGKSAGSPPVLRILLSPSGPRAGEVLVIRRGGSDYFSLRIDYECARAASPYVDA